MPDLFVALVTPEANGSSRPKTAVAVLFAQPYPLCILPRKSQ
jgi:hypothetical protein